MGEPQGPMTDTAAESLEERMLRLASRRTTPGFLVLDEAWNVVARTADLDVDRVIARTKRAVARGASEKVRGDVFLEPLDESSVLRIVALSGADADHTVVFVEQVKSRGSIEAAAARYGLTKRECEVLQLVVRGLTSAQVAQRLYISEATVGDHIKSLMRKAKSSKRSELIARVYDDDALEQPAGR